MSSAVLLVCSAAPTCACASLVIRRQAGQWLLLLLHSCPSLPAHLVAAHVAVVLAGERLWRFTRRETCLASNANIGGEGWDARPEGFL